MKYVFYLWVFISLSSCSLEKRLEKYCPLCVQKNNTETIIEYKDTLIKIPGETLYIQDTLYCDSLGNVLSKLEDKLKTNEGSLIKLQTRLRNNVYTSYATVDTIYKTIKGLDVYHTKVITKTLKPLKIKYTPSWIIFLAYVGGLVLIVLVIYLLFKLITRKLI